MQKLSLQAVFIRSLWAFSQNPISPFGTTESTGTEHRSPRTRLSGKLCPNILFFQMWLSRSREQAQKHKPDQNCARDPQHGGHYRKDPESAN